MIYTDEEASQGELAKLEKLLYEIQPIRGDLNGVILICR